MPVPKTCCNSATNRDDAEDYIRFVRLMEKQGLKARKVLKHIDTDQGKEELEYQARSLQSKQFVLKVVANSQNRLRSDL